MTPDRLITLAIHTYEKALPLKTMLEREGIHVELHNVNLTTPTVSPGVRIRIKESDLPLALRIIENIEIFSLPADFKESTSSFSILVPTDFSDYCYRASLLAFRIAGKMNGELIFLHAYPSEESVERLQMSDAYNYTIPDNELNQISKREAEEKMARFASELKEEIKQGAIPAVRFSTVVAQGIPEEVILDYTRSANPHLVVMGTREADKKEAELIGSVTAEVLDSCRVTAFTLPENIDDRLLDRIGRVAFFCNLDQEDMIALDSLNRLFPGENLDITLIHIPGRRDRTIKTDSARKNLLSYCSEHFPKHQFTFRSVEPSKVNTDLTELTLCSEINNGKGEHSNDDEINNRHPESECFSLICVPNKRRYAFTRLFNPSLAHRILFKADIPMLVLPV